MNIKKNFQFFLGVLAFMLPATFALAVELNSSSFIIKDPIIGTLGGYSASGSFQAFFSGEKLFTDNALSSSFLNHFGLLYYPYVNSGTLSATTVPGEADLSWTASSAGGGWSVSGYRTGKSSISGGPYTYTSVGNVTSYSYTSLSAGNYCFIVQTLDGLGEVLVTSNEDCVTVTAVTPPGGGGGGGGSSGGGGGGPPPVVQNGTKVILKGRTSPKADLVVFKDGKTIATPVADFSGNFEVSSDVAGGVYTFSIYAIDELNRRSVTSSFTVQVVAGQATTITGIFIPPTINADKSQVKVGNEIKFFGYTFPESSINVTINSEHQITDKTTSDKLGFWDYTLNSSRVEKGDHVTKTQAVAGDSTVSPFSESFAFRVGDKDVAFGIPVKETLPVAACNKNGDINKDNKVNLIDFSILLFFWNQKAPKNPCADINQDKSVNVSDFSIMMYWWTG